MNDLQLRIECAERDVANASEHLRIAETLWRIAAKNRQPIARFRAAANSAQIGLNEAEVRLRALYEGKGDWVALSHSDSPSANPAPVAHR